MATLSLLIGLIVFINIKYYLDEHVCYSYHNREQVNSDAKSYGERSSIAMKTFKAHDWTKVWENKIKLWQGWDARRLFEGGGDRECLWSLKIKEANGLKMCIVTVLKYCSMIVKVLLKSI